jgi:hypothetical protein
MKKIYLILGFFFFFLFFGVKSTRLMAYTPVGNYLVLNGGHVKTSGSISPSGVFKFNAWINPDNVSGISHILSIGNNNITYPNYEVDINGGSLTFRYRFGNGSQVLLAAGSITPNIWSNIEVVVNSTNAYLSINGQKLNPQPGASQLIAIGDTIVLGDSYLEPFNSANSFKGLLDEVTINDGELVWHLDESRGQNITSDSSGHHLDGQLIGGDNAIHFFGVLPSPTPIVFPTSGFSFVLPTLPQLRFPIPTQRITPVSPSGTINPTIPQPTPITDVSLRTNRPIAPR